MQLQATQPKSDAQKRFEATYITASQIADYLGISRVAVYKAAEDGRIPAPIIVEGGGKLWESATATEHVTRWKQELDAKRQHV